jgi:cytidylate kinase
MSQVVIISGPPGAGKSAVAEALCERYDRTVHLETDAFYRSIRMGYVSPWLPASSRQNAMVSRAVSRAAGAYASELFAVFIDGVIGPHLLAVYVDELRPLNIPVQIALLMPDVETIVRRGLAREDVPRVQEADLRRGHEMFARWGSFAGCTFDNSRLTAQEAADLVMAACGRGDCLV